MDWKLLKLYLFHVIRRGWKRIVCYFILVIILIVTIDVSGVLRHPFELDYETKFTFPIEIPNFPDIVDSYRKNERIPIEPINTLHMNISYLQLGNDGCGDGQYRLIILVKSAGANFKHRATIRNTWGNPKRFSDVKIKTVFLLGRVGNPRELTGSFDGKLRPMSNTIIAEGAKYKDIIQGDFRDTYYNNTLKTLLGLRWLNQICTNFRFAFFADDDMYVSIKNLLKFIRNPSEYPTYWENLKVAEENRLQQESTKKKKKKLPVRRNKDYQDNMNIPIPEIRVWKNDPIDFDIDIPENAKLFAGYVFFTSPLRHKLGNKWFVTLDEYPYDRYPPYVPAGSMVMSKPVVQELYFGSLFTKFFRFDDVFLGIVAKKMGIEPFKCKWFDMMKSRKSYYSDDFKYLIVTHDHDPDELRELWFVQKTLGNA